MADDIFEEEGAAPPPAAGTAGVDWALLAASRDKANAFLDHQSRYLELQMEDLHEQRDLTLSHLKFRRWTDWMRVGWQGLLCLALVAVAALIVVAAVDASRARDLAIDPFSVPPDVAAQGLSSEAAANQFSARLNQMSNNDAFYSQSGGSYRDTGSGDIKVVIPQTGISIGQLNQYLRGWLGDETHLSGQIARNGKALSLYLRLGTAGLTVTEPSGDTDKLMQKGAEAVFAADRPLRYGEYLRVNGRLPEALALVMTLAKIGPAAQRSVALSDWGLILAEKGDLAGAIAKYRASAALDPSNPLPRVYLAFIYQLLAHDQLAYENYAAAVRLWTPERLRVLGVVIARTTIPQLRGLALHYKGDYAGAAASYREYRENDGPEPSIPIVLLQEVAFYIAAHDLAAARVDLDAQTPGDSIALWHEADIARSLGDWKGVVAWSNKADAVSTPASWIANYYDKTIWPVWAVALARTGDIKGAEVRIAKSPVNCDPCQIARAQIAAAEGDMPRAAAGFAAVASRSPDIPYADTAWGEALLRHGDFDDAIAKLDAAHRIGPRFADPLEFCGEALIAANRSDLALDKFAQAAALAPRWGRLHLKWGEALLWLGRRTEARVQFMTAAALDLSPRDQATVRRLITAD